MRIRQQHAVWAETQDVGSDSLQSGALAELAPPEPGFTPRRPSADSARLSRYDPERQRSNPVSLPALAELVTRRTAKMAVLYRNERA